MSPSSCFEVLQSIVEVKSLLGNEMSQNCDVGALCCSMSKNCASQNYDQAETNFDLVKYEKLAFSRFHSKLGFSIIYCRSFNEKFGKTVDCWRSMLLL